MKLIPLREEQLECLRGALQARLDESRFSERTTVDKVLATIKATYASRMAGAYVDDLTDPKHVLIMSHFPGADVFGLQAFISMIWIAPDQRGSLADVNVMMEAAESYARLNNCRYLVGTSVTYRGAKPITPIFIAHGFEEQEIVLIKHLT